MMSSDGKLQRPDIFGYHDHRSFFGDWMEYLKAKNPHFSLRMLSRDAGLSSGYLPLILNSTRSFSKKALTLILPHLQLSPTEQTYLKLLRNLGEAKSATERIDSLHRIQKFREFQELNPKELEVYRYMSHWYYVAIREMAHLPGFKLNSEWIQNKLQFKVPLGEVTKAIAFLVENKFIEVRDDGSVVPPEKDLKCAEGIYRIVLSQFQREILTLAEKSIDEVAREQRKLGGYSLAIPQNEFSKIAQIIEETIQKLKALEESGRAEADSVYHVMFAGFPMCVG